MCAVDLDRPGGRLSLVSPLLQFVFGGLLVSCTPMGDIFWVFRILFWDSVLQLTLLFTLRNNT